MPAKVAPKNCHKEKFMFNKGRKFKISGVLNLSLKFKVLFIILQNISRYW